MTLTFSSAKDELGYVVPEAAWQRLCMQKPSLPTDDFDLLFLPPDDACLRIGNMRCCQARARVTTTGRAVWKYSGMPCNAILKSVDSYRRHVIMCHLGCPRGDQNKLANCIRELASSSTSAHAHSTMK